MMGTGLVTGLDRYNVGPRAPEFAVSLRDTAKNHGTCNLLPFQLVVVKNVRGSKAEG